MKKIYIICSLLLLLVKVNAQDNTIDSLTQLLSVAKEDTNKVQILFYLGSTYQWNKPDSALWYGLRARELSRQINYIDGELMITSVLSEALCTKGNYSKALEIDLEALQLAEKTGKQDHFWEAVRAYAHKFFSSC